MWIPLWGMAMSIPKNKSIIESLHLRNPFQTGMRWGKSSTSCLASKPKMVYQRYQRPEMVVKYVDGSGKERGERWISVEKQPIIYPLPSPSTNWLSFACPPHKGFLSHKLTGALVFQMGMLCCYPPNREIHQAGGPWLLRSSVHKAHPPSLP